MTSDASKMIEGLGNMLMVAEAVVGYRKVLVEGGVPDAVADDMSREYHTTLIEAMKAGARQHGRR